MADYMLERMTHRWPNARTTPPRTDVFDIKGPDEWPSLAREAGLSSEAYAPVSVAAIDARGLLAAAEELLAGDMLSPGEAERLRASIDRVNAVTPREFGGDQLGS